MTLTQKVAGFSVSCSDELLESPDPKAFAPLEEEERRALVSLTEKEFPR